MTELENGNFLMTPRESAFTRNPFSSCCFPFVTRDSWGASSDLERVLFSLLLALHFCDYIQMINEDPQAPTRQFERVCSPGSMWLPAREAHTKLKGRREKSFAISYFLGFPMNSLHESSL